MQNGVKTSCFNSKAESQDQENSQSGTQAGFQNPTVMKSGNCTTGTLSINTTNVMAISQRLWLK